MRIITGGAKSSVRIQIAKATRKFAVRQMLNLNNAEQT